MSAFRTRKRFVHEIIQLAERWNSCNAGSVYEETRRDRDAEPLPCPQVSVDRRQRRTVAEASLKHRRFDSSSFTRKTLPRKCPDGILSGKKGIVESLEPALPTGALTCLRGSHRVGVRWKWEMTENNGEIVRMPGAEVVQVTVEYATRRALKVGECDDGNRRIAWPHALPRIGVGPPVRHDLRFQRGRRRKEFTPSNETRDDNRTCNQRRGGQAG